MLGKAIKLSSEIIEALSGLFAPAIAWQASGARCEIIENNRRIFEPARLTIAEQWNRLSDIIRLALTRADEATRCHAAAGRQLDLAQYGLITLVDELSAVMDMPGRRRRATVHVLDVAPVRAFSGAIAA